MGSNWQDANKSGNVRRPHKQSHNKKARKCQSQSQSQSNMQMNKTRRLSNGQQLAASFSPINKPTMETAMNFFEEIFN